MTTWRNANTGCRTAQATAPQASSAAAASVTDQARMLSSRGLSHMGASQDLDAKVGEGHAVGLRRHRHQAVPGHAGRGIDLEELPRAVGA